MMNRLANVDNHFQNFVTYKRTLCVCSAGLLRSPTAAYVLSQPPFNRNTRAAGANKEYALVPVDLPLIEWADEIVFMQEEHAEAVIRRFLGETIKDKKIYVLDVPDQFPYRDPRLVELIQNQFTEVLKGVTPVPMVVTEGPVS